MEPRGGLDPEVMRAIAAEFNAMVALNEALASEMVRVERVVGREGRMTERVALREMNGGWAASVGSINALIGDLVQPTTEVARVISAVAEGDFTQKMALEIEGQQVKGEFLRIGTTVNSMVDQLSSFAAEVTRVAKEVGTDGKLGGQAEVPEAAGIWRDLTDNVNLLANNLTAQVRNIAEVTTAVATRRPVEEDHRRREGRGARAQEHRQHDGRSAQLASPPRSRASRRRSVPRASWAARPR